MGPEQREAVPPGSQKQARIETQHVKGKVGMIPSEWGYNCISNAANVLGRNDANLDFELPAVFNLGTIPQGVKESSEDGRTLKRDNHL